VKETPSADDGSSPWGDAVGNNLNGKALRIADRLISGVAVAHYAWQFDRQLQQLITNNQQPITNNQ
jgi:hypothetical protein